MIHCIIVLSNEMSKTGELNSESKSRLEYGCDFFLKNDQCYLITAGWNYRKDSNLFIGERMSQYAIKKRNVPSEKVFAEISSRDTVGDAFFSKINYVEKNKFEKILVITSNYHVLRTSKIFNFIYGDNYKIDVKGIDGFDSNEKIDHERKSCKAFLETFKGITKGDTNNIYKRLKKSHPFYNGEIYPKI